MPNKLYKLKNRTQYAPSDDLRVKTVIGGKTDYFSPSVNFSFEFESGIEKLFLNICDDPEQIDTSMASESFSGGKVKVKVGSVESSFEMSSGVLKINRTFDSAPLEAPRYRIKQSPDIFWFYQPELTIEEKFEEYNRPDDVVGSYAIYCKNKGSIKRKTGETVVNYQTGKLCHMFAPYWVDATGSQIKGSQNFDGKWLAFPLPPEKWLNDAIFPITLDPTIGYTTAGGTTGRDTSAIIAGLRYVSGVAGDANPGAFYTYTKVDSGSLKRSCGAYVNNAGTVSGQAKLSSGNTILTVTDTSFGWKSASITWTGISATTDYFLGIHSEAYLYWAYDTVTSEYEDTEYKAVAYNDTLPDPFPTGLSTISRAYSDYIEYTETGLSYFIPQIMTHKFIPSFTGGQ